MDHLVALRHEVDHMRAEVRANSQVVEAVGRAVSEMYQSFQPTTPVADQGGTYSQNFQLQQNVEDF